MLEEEKHERSGTEASRGAEASQIVHPLCGCSAGSDQFLVLTCPRCMGVALRAMKELQHAD